MFHLYVRKLKRGILAIGRLASLALLASHGGCEGPDSVPAQPIFPADYRTTFVEVRDCRLSNEHAATIRIWANDVGVAAYLARAAVLPEGSIIVKEEFEGLDCSNDAELAFWSVMKKEAAGFDADANDWRFQEISAPNRAVTLDTKATCIRCHVEPECLMFDLMCAEP